MLERLRQIYLIRENRINQKINIRDIYVLHKGRRDSFGEKTSRSVSQYPPVLDRLTGYIELLADIANQYHEAYYLQSENLNCITRILLPEYALYTQVPLSLDDYSQLVDRILEIAINRHENVHLLLGSFAVATGDNTLLNLYLYVQCGHDPRIQVICKARAAYNEERYAGTYPFCQQPVFYNEKNYWHNKFSPFVADREGVNISNDSVFIVETAGGAQYLQAVDICYDHTFSHSLNLTKTLVARGPDKDTGIVPDQVDHVLVSNTHRIHDASMVTKNSFTHADAKFSKNSVIPMRDDKVQITLTSVPFGACPMIIATEERTLGRFIDTLKSDIADRNERVKNYVTDHCLSTNFRCQI